MTYSQVAYHVPWRHANSFERASQEFQPHGLSLLLMTYSHVAYHVHWRHAKQLQTSITGISAAWLILTTHELQPSGLSCPPASCQTAPSSNTGISAVWPILTAHELQPHGLSCSTAFHSQRDDFTVVMARGDGKPPLPWKRNHQTQPTLVLSRQRSSRGLSCTKTKT